MNPESLFQLSKKAFCFVQENTYENPIITSLLSHSLWLIGIFLIHSWIFHNTFKCIFSKNFIITPTDKTPGSWLAVVYLLFGYINNYFTWCVIQWRTSSCTSSLSHTYDSLNKLYIYLSAKKEVTELTSWLPQWLYLLRQWSCKILNCMLNRLAFCNYAFSDMR